MIRLLIDITDDAVALEILAELITKREPVTVMTFSGASPQVQTAGSLVGATQVYV